MTPEAFFHLYAIHFLEHFCSIANKKNLSMLKFQIQFSVSKALELVHGT